MALTLTRTRTQTTLTKLARMVANVHGELEFLEVLLAQGASPATGAAEGTEAFSGQDRLLARRQVLLSNREALYATIKRFDPALEPAEIGCAQDWRLSYGRKGTSEIKLVARYTGTAVQK
jgi:hypothetical protein